MFNITGKYVTVFNPQAKLGSHSHTVVATLSTSKKNVIDGAISYDNMSWNGRFVGACVDKAMELKEFDKIDITKGSITNHYDKESKRLYVDVTVFDFEMSTPGHKE